VQSGNAEVTVVHTSPGDTTTRVRRIAEEAGWTPRDLAERLAPPMTAAARTMPEAALLVVGGETTGAVTHSLGVGSYVVSREPAPGVALGVTGRTDPPLLVTKPGAFGPPEVLCAVTRTLLRR
ncbi:MAG: nucleotide-binding domain containing protein, partial [Stackebrandtia sp.]